MKKKKKPVRNEPSWERGKRQEQPLPAEEEVRRRQSGPRKAVPTSQATKEMRTPTNHKHDSRQGGWKEKQGQNQVLGGRGGTGSRMPRHGDEHGTAAPRSLAQGSWPLK